MSSSYYFTSCNSFRGIAHSLICFTIYFTLQNTYSSRSSKRIFPFCKSFISILPKQNIYIYFLQENFLLFWSSFTFNLYLLNFLGLRYLLFQLCFGILKACLVYFSNFEEIFKIKKNGNLWLPL